MERAWDLWGFKHTNICIIGVPEGEEREKGPETIFRQLIAESFPSMGKGNSQPSPGSIENPLEMLDFHIQRNEIGSVSYTIYKKETLKLKL